jgi:hypothetical protein
MTHPTYRHVAPVPLLALLALLATAPRARAQTSDDPDRVPTGARRAAEWRPSPAGSDPDSWFVSGTAGIGWFTGDDGIDGDPGFTLELRGAREITGDFYVVGSYLLAFAKTEVSLEGTSDRDTHVLHVPTIGLGYRAELSPEVHLFVEPRLGVLFGSDADAAPVGGAAAGVELEVRPGLLVNVRLTGLFTDASLDTAGLDQDLNGIFSVGVGLTWEF